jgi:7,8-dihydropterin-6-yl-methyl-4-(beta-D-ribofuranosyl)aminobenzene 5'-phosphate synthase
LHLAHASDDQVWQVADAIRRSGIEHLYTGHCTGDLAMVALRKALPGRIASLYPGFTLQLATGRAL